MSGIIDTVCNLYTPRTVAEGRTGLDDAFRNQVRMPRDTRGGVNIFPREVEEVLLRHPDILDAAVVGVPDERWGESLKAFVVPRPGLTLKAQELAEFCEGRLARFKIPRTLETLSALPRNAYGKMLKGELQNYRSNG